MRRHLITTCLAVTMLGLAACGGPAAVGDTPAADLDGSFELVDGTSPDGPIALVDTHPVTLAFDLDEGTLGGISACNHYGGDVRIDGDQIAITDLFATNMGCMPSDVTTTEQAYLATLDAVDHLEVDDENRLVLSGPDAELVFIRLPEPEVQPLTGTSWVLGTLFDGEIASSIPQSPQPVTLVLADDGTFQATTGCNSLDGTWREAGDRLALSVDVRTDADCPDLQELEDHVIGVLDGEVAVDLAASGLTITADDGRGLGYGAED
jgi:heat shock protein HslJ